MRQYFYSRLPTKIGKSVFSWYPIIFMQFKSSRKTAVRPLQTMFSRALNNKTSILTAYTPPPIPTKMPFFDFSR